MVSVGLVILLTHCAPPSPPLWSPAELATLRSLALSSLSPPPAAPSNRYARDVAAVALGQSLFFDTRLSRAADQSCASCHQPERYFTDGRRVGRGVNDVTRNTPSVIGGAWQTWFYWDGRRDSLWSQAVIPIEAPDEMAGSRSATARLMATDPAYRTAYEAVFGSLPTSLDAQTLPAHAGRFTDAAGQDAWFRLSPTRQRAVNEVYANVGKAIAAYERTLVPEPSAFDRYVETVLRDGPESAAGLLTAAQIAGAKLFIDVEKTRCMQCHNGPLMTNGGFHNVASGGMSGPQPDLGRFLGVQSALLDEFNCLGPFSDAPRRDCTALRFLARDDHGDSAGAFKVPSLRNVARTGPYFHDGRFATLREVLAHYNEPPSPPGELLPLTLRDEELDHLEAFLNTLSSPVPPSPRQPADARARMDKKRLASPIPGVAESWRDGGGSGVTKSPADAARHGKLRP